LIVAAKLQRSAVNFVSLQFVQLNLIDVRSKGGVMKKIVLGLIAAGFLAMPALAADMALKAPLLPPAPLWTGWYIGANGGGGWENTNWTFPTAQFFATAAGQSFSTNPSGGIAGGQVGYNYQFGHWVVGGELMGDWANLSNKVTGPVPAFPFDSFTTKLQDLESLSLRLGYAPANWLFYGKAGIATGGINLSALSGVPVPGVAFSNTQRLWGPTVGAGLEFMWTPHFVVGVEYDFTSFGGESVLTTASCNGNPACAGFGAVPVSMNSGFFNISTVTGRISYKF
jgi:outer membrane immunogenic protein